jgi:hypothetical protein
MTTDRQALNVVNAAKAWRRALGDPARESRRLAQLVKALDDLFAVERIERRIVKVKAKKWLGRPALKLVQVEDQ